MRPTLPSTPPSRRRRAEPFSVQLGHRIRELRKSRNWSQRDLAAHANLSLAQLSKYESGAATPPLRAVVRLARAFGLLVDMVLPPSEEPALDEKDDARLFHGLRDLLTLGPLEKELVIGLLQVVQGFARLREPREGEGPTPSRR